MPTPTYTPLANTTLGSGVSILTFSSISQSYRDLVLVINGANASGTDVAFYVTLNSDLGSNYNEVNMLGDSSGGTGSFSATNAGASTVGRMDTTQATYILNFMDYSATDKHKTFLTRANTSLGIRAYAHRWASTSAVNSIRIAATSSTFATGTTMALYGIAS